MIADGNPYAPRLSDSNEFTLSVYTNTETTNPILSTFFNCSQYHLKNHKLLLLKLYINRNQKLFCYTTMPSNTRKIKFHQRFILNIFHKNTKWLYCNLDIDLQLYIRFTIYANKMWTTHIPISNQNKSDFNNTQNEI